MIDINSVKRAFSNEYKVIDILGKGGMATVFKAVHLSLNRVVALKIIPKEYSENVEFKTRFEREAIDSARLSHPNIITIYDHGEKDGYQYISMAHLPGKSLSDKIRESGALTETEAKKILIPILEGVAFAHSNGIIHRDIKSSNIMFDANDNPILMDFGISKSKDSINLTISGSFIGTLEYASPEQIESSDVVDNRSDIYSIGILAYEMVTGTVPFKGSMTSVINHVVNTPPPQIQSINANISTEFGNIITKAIEKKPEDRYQNAREFIEGLKNVRGHTQTITTATAPPQQNKTFINSNKKQQKSKKNKKKSLRNAAEVTNNNPINKSRKNTIIVLGILSAILIVLIFSTLAFYFYEDEPEVVETSNTVTVQHVQPTNQFSIADLKNQYGIKMIEMEDGKFLMGADNGELDEQPKHPVKINHFYISSTEITQYSWKKVMKSLPSGNAPCNDCPVVNVSWNDAMEFVLKLKQLTGLNISLPYENEWEYAAKEGRHSLNRSHVPVYSGSINPKAVGWYSENSGNSLHRVAQLNDNDLGLFDMSGNVWEWCYDNYQPDYYRSQNPNYSGSQNGSNKVLRGGSFSDSKLEIRNTNREKAPPGLRRNNIGFRIVIR